MPKYNFNFNLNVEDINLIEQALRSEIKSALQPEKDQVLGFSEPAPDNVKKISNLLGRIHDQKIFYSVANPSGVPLG